MSAEKKLNLNISELIIVDEPSTIYTVLGSCVSVCLFSPQTKHAGMIHYALPYFMESSSMDELLRYGDKAIPILIEELQKVAHQPIASFKAKVIGGANCFIRSSGGGLDNIGAMNIQMAKDILQKYNIEIIGEHTGGEVGRKVIFHTTDGRVQVASLTALT